MANQVSKLAYVDSKLGSTTAGQQTTRTLYHTVLGAGVTASVEFFKNFNGLTLGQTNLVQNKLDSMESMVVKTITLLQFDNGEFGDGVAVNVGNNAGLTTSYPMTIDVTIGNERVVKALPISFNQGTTGQAFDRLHENGGGGLYTCEIRLLTDIVIPPQVEFSVRLNGFTPATNFSDAVVCVLSGYGKIFSAGSSF